jgi:hypothetical protein
MKFPHRRATKIVDEGNKILNKIAGQELPLMMPAQVHAYIMREWWKLLKDHAEVHGWEVFHKPTKWLYEARDGMLVGIGEATLEVKQTSIDKIEMESGYYAIIKGVLKRIEPNI